MPRRCSASCFPRQIALGNWLGGALLWHFAAMWLLMTNGVVYVVLGFATGRFRRKLLPICPREVVRDLVAALRGGSRMTTSRSTTRCRSSSIPACS